MTEQYEGIVNPPIDSLLEKVESKYALVLFAAKRARQINAYYSQLHEGLFEYVGPLVDTKLNEKPLSISMREIDADLLEMKPVSEVEAREAARQAEEFDGFDVPANVDPFQVPGVEEPAAPETSEEN
ncbi:DNA-directed RNA polymerase subunit omega [Citricoccus muralis]|uniref:DNA-directed RNA polymerase subunit omega n=1 Tax=Citricoccus muralis TaxID=169134 RepID=A0ABY8H2Q5_9MICC|nr:DNA-directed RNA polymerase subunit omega [Citricoccus muralis]WFP15414.1 DNA-directed RNA polymerase subunit omega [Citricoccus muralis]